MITKCWEKKKNKDGRSYKINFKTNQQQKYNNLILIALYKMQYEMQYDMKKCVTM